ncbi:MAG: RagB/SusD family nutrient uptake outer membrane protein [Rikenellaceae bacterium]
MKRLIYIFLVLTTLSSTSCEGFLDKDPNMLSTATFYENDSQAIEGVNAVYAVFYDFYLNHVGFDVDCLSDDIIKGHGTDFSDYVSFNIGQIPASNSAVSSLWGSYYKAIYRANYVIDNVEGNGTISDETANMVLGEAYFLRAYFYHEIVQRWGDCPLITSTIDQLGSPARTPKDEVYTQIENDLLRASELLSYIADADAGRPNIGAAKSLLGLVYLSQNKFEECYDALTPVVTDEGGKYGYYLIEDLDNLFQLDNNNGPESIFEIQSRHEAPLGETIAFNHWIRPRGLSVHGGLGFPMPTQSLFDEFEDGDLRREFAIIADGESIAPELGDECFSSALAPETGYSYGKYVKGVDVGDYQERLGQNKKLIRYAEVLLAYAEAAYESGHASEAWSTLEIVRTRAFLGTPPKYSTDFTEAIRHERRVELAGENKRYFDLLRWGIAEQVLTADCKKHDGYSYDYVFNSQAKGLYPIPQTELDSNTNPDFYQTDGY